MQTLAILSDVHGNLPALESVVADLAGRQVEAVVNLGDHLSGPLWPKETAWFLMRQEWIQIRGNHDRQITEQDPLQHAPSDRYAYQQLSPRELDWLRSLPAQQDIEGGLLAFHGTPATDSAYLLETVEHGRGRLASPAEIQSRLGGAAAAIMLCGHTHIPRLVETAVGLVINPGSVGLQAFTDDLPDYHVMETGSPQARYALLARQEGRWVADFIAVPYDHHRAADQARAKGRPDWEAALRTGFLSPRK